MKVFKHQQAGLSLIEFMLYLAMSMVAFIGIAGIMTQGFRESQAHDLIRGLSATQSGARVLRGARNDYGTADLTQAIIQYGRIPPTFRVVGSTIQHGLGGTVRIVGQGGEARYEVSGVPTDVCIPVLTFSKYFTSVRVDGSAATVTPVTADQATTLCTASDPAAGHSLVFLSN